VGADAAEAGVETAASADRIVAPSVVPSETPIGRKNPGHRVRSK
jgi:hypothetical protein